MENKESSLIAKGDNLPWNRQEGEPLKVYFAFEQFLSLGANRTISEAARQANICRASLTRYASRWNWRERAIMHDKFFAEMNRSKNALIIEELHSEIQEEFIKTEIYLQRAIVEMNNLLKDFWAYYENPRTMNKVKYINKLVTTMNKLYRMISQKMPNSMLNEVSIRNININNMLNLNQDIERISMEKEFATKNAFDELEEAIRPNLNRRE